MFGTSGIRHDGGANVMQYCAEDGKFERKGTVILDCGFFSRKRSRPSRPFYNANARYFMTPAWILIQATSAEDEV
jgi:hypothetical protein